MLGFAVTRSTEATAINRDFAKQIMAPHLTKCAYPSPFSPAQDVHATSMAEA